MSSRTRYRANDVFRGTAVYNTGVQISGSGGIVRIGSEYCVDIVRTKAQGDCQYFEVETFSIDGGRLNGKSPSAEFSQFYGTVYETWNNFPHHTSLPGSPSNATVATEAAARTNPSRPHVDILANVLQLPEMVDLMRFKGSKILLKAAGSVNLAWQFGILPIVGDLWKTREFVDQATRRLAILDKLQTGKGYRKTTKHGGYSASGTYTKTLQSQGVILNIPYQCVTNQTIKAHTRWKPVGSFRKMDAKSKRILANDALRGIVSSSPIKIDFYSVWQAIPWSWLIDWATDMSNYLIATRNIVPCRHDGTYVMRTTQTTYQNNGGSTNNGKLTYEPVTVTRTNKKREKGIVAPYAHLPLLEANQMGILASLAVTKGR